MTRSSVDHINCEGITFRGYDYDIQCWVEDYIIQDCGHPETMRPGCCNGDRLKGKDIRNIKMWSK